MHLHKGGLFGSSLYNNGAFAALFFLHVLVSFYYISQHNITYDEPQYMEYAKRWLHGHPERVESLDDSKSPVIAIAWIPRIARQVISPAYTLTDYGVKDQKEGRYMMIFFSLLTAVYMCKWCKSLYGNGKWLLPLALLLFDPLYLSYSTLITTDLACGAFLLALLYHYRNYLIQHSRKHFYWAALFAGAGIVTKQSLVFAVILLPLLSLIYQLLLRGRKRIITRKSVTDTIIFVVIIVLVINAAYYFHRTGIPFGNYIFESRSLQNLKGHLSFLKAVPVPLPEAYIQSIDMLQAHSEAGAGSEASTYNGVYLFGELKLSGGYWYYYVVLFFYKMPPGTLLLFCSCIPLFFRKFTRQSFAATYQFLLIPSFFFWFILSFINPFQTGIRHLLLVFPLLYIGLGYLFLQLANTAHYKSVLVTLAIAYNFISIGVYYPYLLAYTNELIGDKRTVYRKICDSSVDYRQSDSSIHLFLAAHREYKMASPIPAAGKYIVGMSQVCNTYIVENNPFKWYDQLKPTGHYRYVFLLYDVKKSDVRNIRVNVGLPVIKK